VESGGGGLTVSGVSRNRGGFVKCVAIQKRLGIPAILTELPRLLIIYGEERKLWRSSCNIPQHLATSFVLGSNVVLSTLFSNTLSLFKIKEIWMWYVILYDSYGPFSNSAF
jgi:hypothetical protein